MTTETFWALIHAQHRNGIFNLKQEKCSAHPAQFDYRTKLVTNQRDGGHTEIIYKLFVAVKANLAMNFESLQQQIKEFLCISCLFYHVCPYCYSHLVSSICIPHHDASIYYMTSVNLISNACISNHVDLHVHSRQTVTQNVSEEVKCHTVQNVTDSEIALLWPTTGAWVSILYL